MTTTLSARARQELKLLNQQPWNFVPLQSSQRLYITQAALVRAGLAEWLNGNRVQITDAGRKALEPNGDPS